MSATQATGVFAFPAVQVNGGALTAGTQYESPGPLLSLPDLNLRPRAPVSIERMYIPISVFTNVAANPPAECSYTLSGRVRGALLWSHGDTIKLTPYAANPTNFSLGAADVAEDLVNPLFLDVSDVVEVFLRVGFDQSVNTFNFGLGSVITAVSGGAAVQTPTAGSAYWTAG